MSTNQYQKTFLDLKDFMFENETCYKIKVFVQINFSCMFAFLLFFFRLDLALGEWNPEIQLVELVRDMVIETT